jgi:hypothetical protein
MLLMRLEAERAEGSRRMGNGRSVGGRESLVMNLDKHQYWKKRLRMDL